MPIMQVLPKEVYEAVELPDAPIWLREAVKAVQQAEGPGAVPSSILHGDVLFTNVKVTADNFGVPSYITGTLSLVLEGGAPLETTPLIFLAPQENGPIGTATPFISPFGENADSSALFYPNLFFVPSVLPPPGIAPVGWGVTGERTFQLSTGAILVRAEFSVSGPGTLLTSVGFQINVGRKVGS